MPSAARPCPSPPPRPATLPPSPKTDSHHRVRRTPCSPIPWLRPAKACRAKTGHRSSARRRRPPPAQVAATRHRGRSRSADRPCRRAPSSSPAVPCRRLPRQECLCAWAANGPSGEISERRRSGTEGCRTCRPSPEYGRRTGRSSRPRTAHRQVRATARTPPAPAAQSPSGRYEIPTQPADHPVRAARPECSARGNGRGPTRRPSNPCRHSGSSQKCHHWVCCASPPRKAGVYPRGRVPWFGWKKCRSTRRCSRGD